jgi:formylglycine-generating enzyme required for sulfatase activity/tRNA A-37 threonylcarbamoyl transferase component Bud32
MSIVGRSIDRYRVLEQLGQGGMAVVYKAYDARLERDVALKVIRTENIPPTQLDKLMKRFEREAKAQAQFAHNNIVHVYDYGKYENAPYLVMEYLSGGTLKTLTGQPIPYQQAAKLLAPIADAVAYAHARNVLHRDVKPSNILITKEGKPVLSDFGIAKILEAEGTALTGTGLGIGTPEYMAPEQWHGQPVVQTDIYGLGVVFFELVTGRKPYEADTPAAIVQLQVLEPLPRPSELVPDLPEKVERVLFKALALKPEDRYESMATFGKVLAKLGQGVSVEVEEKTLEEIPVAVEAPSDSRSEPLSVEPRVSVQERETSDDLIVQPVHERGKKKLSWLWIALGLLFVFAMIAGGIGLAIASGEIAGVRATRTATATVAPTKTQTEISTSTPTATLTHTPAPTLGIGSTFVRVQDGMEMVYIPAGEFEMGAIADLGYEVCQSVRDDCVWSWFVDEEPVHSIYLDAYWIDRYEVTHAQYAAFLNEMDNQSEGGVTWLDAQDEHVNIHRSGEIWSVDSGYGHHPVFEVSWYGAVAYCEWVGGRLPTEAEWEKAARGGLAGKLYPWGNEAPTCTLGAENGAQHKKCGGQTVDVGNYAPNAYGLFDMAGNVWEWVADWYDSSYYASSPTENPQGPTSGTLRVVRGCSWGDSRSGLLVSNRGYFAPDDTNNGSGFRCASDAN